MAICNLPGKNRLFASGRTNHVDPLKLAKFSVLQRFQRYFQRLTCATT